MSSDETRRPDAGQQPAWQARAAAWAVHTYTASGAVLALLALAAAVAGDLRWAFLWLAAQVFVDATDGWLARLARVDVVTPAMSGTRLDDIVDYLTYVFVPAALVVQSGAGGASVPAGSLVPPGLAWPVAAAMLLSSAIGFSRDVAKTPDHFFTGFPSYWNIVVLYLVVMGLSPAANAAVLLVLAVLVFVPIRYIYPTRTVVWRPLTVALGVVWGAQMILIVWWLPVPPRALVWSSLVFPAYYAALSLALEARRQDES
jgi:phosphatidylcholine synthase